MWESLMGRKPLMYRTPASLWNGKLRNNLLVSPITLGSTSF
jgi:hypothetical protein